MMKRPSNIAVFGLIAIGAWLIMTYGVKQPNPNLKRLMENRMEQTLPGEKAAANRGGADGLDTPSVAGIGGPFSLVDQHGRAVTEADFRGDFMLLNFGFTGCPDICPMQLEAMSEAVDALGADGARVRPVFITIDPERDTIGRMAEFAQNFHPRLVALTGTPRQLERVSQAYRVFHARAEDQGTSEHYLIDHTAYIYLMGPDGKYLAHFEPGASPEAIVEKIRDYM
ncbi:MAG: SCO family protein [Alphaproteobacteria bacterium]